MVKKYGTGMRNLALFPTGGRVVGWPSGLRRWFNTPVISMAWGIGTGMQNLALFPTGGRVAKWSKALV